MKAVAPQQQQAQQMLDGGCLVAGRYVGAAVPTLLHMGGRDGQHVPFPNAGRKLRLAVHTLCEL